MLDDENFDDKLQLNQERIDASRKKYEEDYRINQGSPKQSQMYQLTTENDEEIESSSEDVSEEIKKKELTP